MSEGCAIWDQEFSKWLIKFLSLKWAGNSARPKLFEFMGSKFSRSWSNEDAGWLTRRWRCRGRALRTLKSSNVRRLRSSIAFWPKSPSIRQYHQSKSLFFCFIFDVNNLSTTTHYANQQSKILLRHTDAHHGSSLVVREFPLATQLFRRQRWLPSARALYMRNRSLLLTSKLFVDHAPVAKHQLRPVLLRRVVLVPRHDDKVLAKVDEAVVVSRVIHRFWLCGHLNHNLSQKTMLFYFLIVWLSFYCTQSPLVYISNVPRLISVFSSFFGSKKALFLRCWQ